MIRVKPERSRLVAFARWATVQTPKVGTIGLGEFGVPAPLFVHTPEDVLIGALVDGHRYVSPAEDAAREGRLLACGLCYVENGEEVHPHPECTAHPAGAQELLGVADPAAFTPPVPIGDPEADAAAMVAATSPETIQAAMDAVLVATDLAASNAAAAGGDGSDPSDPGPDYAPLEDAPAGDEDDGQDDDGDGWPCDRCPRSFTTERGRDSHRRQVHRED